MEDEKNVFARGVIIKRLLIGLSITLVWIFCVHNSIHAETNNEMNLAKKDATAIPSGKISIEISNSDALFSRASYYFSLKSSEDNLVRHDTDRKSDFQTAYYRNRFHGEEKRLKELVNLNDLYLVAFKQQPEGWWLTTEGQEEIFRKINPNTQLSHIIFDNWTNSLLIDLGTGDVKHYFQNSDRFSWSKSGKLIAYATKGGNRATHLSFAVLDISLNEVVLKKDINVTSPKKLAQISHIDWSPDSQNVAILTCNVLDLGIFFRLMGHPIATTEFNLLIFNLAGNLVYTRHIDGTYKGGCFARIVWTE